MALTTKKIDLVSSPAGSETQQTSGEMEMAGVDIPARAEILRHIAEPGEACLLDIAEDIEAIAQKEFGRPLEALSDDDVYTLGQYLLKWAKMRPSKKPDNVVKLHE